MIKYILRTPTANGSPEDAKTLVYDDNRLEFYPAPALFENSVLYEESESRHLTSFECSFARHPKDETALETSGARFCILYVSNGSFACGGTVMSLGDAIFAEPYSEHRMTAVENSSEIYKISWEGDITVHIAQMLRNFTTEEIYHVGFCESVTALIDSIIYNKYLSEINLKQLVIGFTDMLLAYFSRAITLKGSEKKPADLISRAKSVIETYYADLTVEQLSNILYVNSKYLSKMFRKHTGMTPKQYITEIKMTHAEHYLVSTEYPIQKVSEIVGYNNYTNFYIAFKNKYGVPPEEYRRSFSEQDAGHKK